MGKEKKKKHKKKKPSVLIGMAVYGPIKHQTFAAYTRMMLYAARNTKEFDFNVTWAFDTFICGAREMIVKQAIEGGYDYVLFLDGDMIWPENMINILVKKAEKMQAPVISGMYCFRNAPHYPMLYEANNDEKDTFSFTIPAKDQWGSIFAVDATGFGACLLRTDLFKKVSEPWFALEGKGTEDIFFFRKTRKELGIKVLVDTSICCGHISNPAIVWPTKEMNHGKPVGISAEIFGDEYGEAHYNPKDIVEKERNE